MRSVGLNFASFKLPCQHNFKFGTFDQGCLSIHVAWELRFWNWVNAMLYLYVSKDDSIVVGEDVIIYSLFSLWQSICFIVVFMVSLTIILIWSFKNQSTTINGHDLTLMLLRKGLI